MQETPDFHNQQIRFNSFTVQQLKGVPPEELFVDIATNELITRIFELLSLYYNDTSFRQQLTYRFRQTVVEAQAGAILNLFDQIVQSRPQGTFQASRQSFLDTLQDQGGEFERQLTPYLVRAGFVSNLKNAVGEIGQVLASTQNQAQTADDEIGVLLNQVRSRAEGIFQLADSVTSTVLGDYFHRAYNGRSIAEQEKIDKRNSAVNEGGSREMQILKRICRSLNKQRLVLILVAIILFLLARVVATPVQHYYANAHPIAALNVGILDWRIIMPGLLVVLVMMLILRMYLNKNFPGGYQRSATLWLVTLFVVVVIVGVVVVHRAGQLVATLSGPNASANPLELVIANGIILAVPAYAIRVCLINYNASKHQAVLNLHRANVLRTFPLIIKAAEDNQQAAQVVYAALADSVFKPGATGHINKGQATDNSSQNYLKDLFN